jgi:hypothetical protein
MYMQSCTKVTLGIFSTTPGLNFQRRKSTRGSKLNPGSIFITQFKILRYTGLMNQDFYQQSLNTDSRLLPTNFNSTYFNQVSDLYQQSLNQPNLRLLPKKSK